MTDPMTDSDRYEELATASRKVIRDWPTNNLAPAVNELRETLEMHGHADDDENVEVRFSYIVSVPGTWIEQDEDGRWRLAAGNAQDAYDMLTEGISDTKGGWFPNYAVLCLQDFMAGQICGREKDHDGDHR